MRTALLVAALCLLAISPLRAQNNVTTQEIGDFTNFGGTLNGEAVSGTAHQIGSTIYYNLTIGGRPVSYTKQVIGQQTYGSDGSSSQRIGGQTYTTTPEGVTYTQQRIGNFLYTHGSNGCMNTTQFIGGQTYTSGNCPK